MNFDDLHQQRIAAIRDIINPHPHISVEVFRDKSVKIVLTEPAAKLTKVTLYGFDEDQTVAFKLDAKRDPSSSRGETIRISEYLNPNAKMDINRGCDGIIFTYLNGRGYVFICEMKSDVPQKKDYIQQFRNSAVFIKFMSALLDEFYGFNLDDFQIKYILFDKKKSYEKTETTRRITPKQESYQGKDLYIYRIHHPNESRSLNIKLLDLSNKYE